jgi:curved DNA-binding protein CbpA
MPNESFRGDPYAALDLAPEATDAQIKRRWRELVRDHHPDRAGADRQEQARLTRKTARFNAAYDLLKDPQRRARYDERDGRRARSARPPSSGLGRDPRDVGRSGPPPPRPTRPVTARFDCSTSFHRRNSTTTSPPTFSIRRPQSARERFGDAEPPRASQPNGPVQRRRSRLRHSAPALSEARATELEFGKFRGHTLGEVADFEPTYIDWIARTITRDRELVLCARVIQADLDERGVERRVRPPTPGFGFRREDITAS